MEAIIYRKANLLVPTRKLHYSRSLNCMIFILIEIIANLLYLKLEVKLWKNYKAVKEIAFTVWKQNKRVVNFRISSWIEYFYSNYYTFVRSMMYRNIIFKNKLFMFAKKYISFTSTDYFLEDIQFLANCNFNFLILYVYLINFSSMNSIIVILKLNMCWKQLFYNQIHKLI